METRPRAAYLVGLAEPWMKRSIGRMAEMEVFSKATLRFAPEFVHIILKLLQRPPAEWPRDGVSL